MNNNIKIVIPTYNCSNKLIAVVKNLRDQNIKNEIYIVDDKSSVNSRIIINYINNKFSNIYIIRNKKNLGQGGSIKNSFKILKNPEYLICTVDDDGQHTTKDVQKILKRSNLIFYNNKVILGARDLFFKITPINSYIGNKLSKFIFTLITKKKIIDTQTGLRFYGKKIANKLLNIDSNGFDFHNIMNFYLVKNKIKIIEIKIQTIYFDKNKKTRFKGMQDSVNILTKILSFNNPS